MIELIDYAIHNELYINVTNITASYLTESFFSVTLTSLSEM